MHRTSTVLDSYFDAFVALDSEWRCVFATAEAGELLGCGAEALIGQCVWNAVPDAIENATLAACQRAMLEQRPVVAVSFHPASGRWFESRIQPSPAGLSVFFRGLAHHGHPEQHYRRLVDTSPYAIYALDAEGRFTEINRAGEEVLGRGAELVLGQPFAGVVAPGDLARVTEAVRRKVDGESDPTEIELEIVRPGGERRLLHVRAAAIREGDRTVGIHGVARDITDDRRAAMEHRTSAQTFSAVLEALGEGVMITDLDDRILYANRRTCEITGYTREELVGQVGEELLVHPDDRGRMPLHNRDRARGLSGSYEMRQVHRDGSEYWVEVHGSPLRNEAGEVIGTAGAITDITERKRFESQLRCRDAILEAVGFAAERLLRSANWEESAADVLARLGEGTAAGRVYLLRNHRPGTAGGGWTSCLFEWVSAGVEPQRGTMVVEALSCGDTGLDAWTGALRREELVHAQAHELPDDVRERLGSQGIRSLVAVPVFVEGEWWGTLGLDECRGERDWSLVEREALRTAASTLGAAIERQRAEDALRRSELWGRTLFESAAEGISVHDLSGRILNVNERLCSMLGYSREEMLRLSVADLDANFEAERFDQLWQQMRPGVPLALEGMLLHRDGGTIPMEVRVTRTEMEGRPVVLALLRDIRERRQLEEQLRQSQKMEAVGRLAGGVAHDFNNQLTAILGFARLLELDVGPESGVLPFVGEILKAAERSAKLTHQLLAFGRKQVLQPRVLDLNAVVANLDLLLRRLIDRDIELVTLPGSAMGRVRADPAQLEQVLINLVINARDAMPGGGRIIVQTLERRVEEPLMHRPGMIPAGDYMVLAVSDNGCGMDGATLERVFEPFFTTKAPGEGTGLGLSMVLGIVQQSGGHISVHSEPGAGSTFQIYLPRVRHAVTAELLPQQTPPRPGGGTVLLVEDEPAVRALARTTLRRSGYAVIEAENGEEALRIWNEQRQRIDLVLTDLTMPLMGGRELGRRLSGEPERVPVVYMSGYTEDLRITDEERPHARFVAKPFDPAELVAAVQAAWKATSP